MRILIQADENYSLNECIAFDHKYRHRYLPYFVTYIDWFFWLFIVIGRKSWGLFTGIQYIENRSKSSLCSVDMEDIGKMMKKAKKPAEEKGPPKVSLPWSHLLNSENSHYVHIQPNWSPPHPPKKVNTGTGTGTFYHCCETLSNFVLYTR